MSRMIIAVHDGKFHADELVALAIMNIAGSEFNIIRTRKQEELAKATMCIDVGGTYSPETGDFDHHMREDCPLREDGKRYAAAGLIWKRFGLDALFRINYELSDKEIRKAWELVDRRFIRPVDLADNGQAPMVEDTLTLMSVVNSFNPPADSSVEEVMTAFNAALDWVETALIQCCKSIIQDVLDMGIVAEAANEAISNDSPIWVLPKAGLPWLTWIKENWESTTQLKVVIFPDPAGDSWRVQTLPGDPVDTFQQRCPAPVELAGKRDTQWKRFDVVFVHPGRFIGGVKGNETTAREFAQAWINNSSN